MGAQEAFEREGESGYYLTGLLMKQCDQIGRCFLSMRLCREKQTKTPSPNPTWSYKAGGVSVMRVRTAETFRRMLPRVRN